MFTLKKKFSAFSIVSALLISIIFSSAVVPAAYAATGANFSESGGIILTLDLLAGASVDVISNGASYTFTLSGTDTWSGTDSANVTGNGTNTLTVTSARDRRLYRY